jgi:uncharacterized Zn-finger protein
MRKPELLKRIYVVSRPLSYWVWPGIKPRTSVVGCNMCSIFPIWHSESQGFLPHITSSSRVALYHIRVWPGIKPRTSVVGCNMCSIFPIWHSQSPGFLPHISSSRRVALYHIRVWPGIKARTSVGCNMCSIFPIWHSESPGFLPHITSSIQFWNAFSDQGLVIQNKFCH